MRKEKPINIFIVDDNSVFTLALKADIETAFKNMSFEIHLFETGEKCMRRFMLMMPELVILDYNLNSKYPDAEDGIKVLEWIKNENKETYVIMLTSNDHIDIALESFKHGASDYVVKTETQFRKINYSLLNFFQMQSAKKEAKKYKQILISIFLFLALLIGGIIVMQKYTSTAFI